MKARPKKHPAFQTPTLLAGVLLLLIVFVSAGYIIATHPEDEASSAPELKSLNSAKRQWQRLEPSAYSYAVDRDCYCPDEWRETYVVSVRGGTTQAELKQEPGRIPPEPVTIDSLFDLLEQALVEADAVTVTYDTDFGFPDNIRIDWRSELVDDEQAFYIRELRALP